MTFKIVRADGWIMQKLRFNVVAGPNRHLVEINAGRWKKDTKSANLTEG